MTAEAAGTRPLVVFRGPVQVLHGHGAATLVLRGREALAPDRHQEFTELVFADAHAGSLPAVLRDARVLGPEPAAGAAPGLRRYRIEATADSRAAAGAACTAEVLARSVQRHREAAQAFFGAVPPPHVARSRRLGWLTLLWVLRVPGVARIVERLRGTT